jgi:hypothetical protein
MQESKHREQHLQVVVGNAEESMVSEPWRLSSNTNKFTEA